MKTFDYTQKMNNPNNHNKRNSNIDRYITKGFQTSANQLNQKFRRDLVAQD